MPQSLSSFLVWPLAPPHKESEGDRCPVPGVLALSPRDRDRACWYSFQCHELIPWPQEVLELGARALLQQPGAPGEL